MFWRKRKDNLGEKIINSIEYEHCLKRISEISAEMQALRVKIVLLETDCSNLRGRFNQRLKSFGTEEIKKPEIETKEINTNEPIYI